jgi:metal-responsive CopG/Arc/MetJ family transcriptional regulator
MRISVSLPNTLVKVADTLAKRRGTTRSRLLGSLLEAEMVREQTRRYINRHLWDVAEDEESWREYQRRRMAEEYRDDEW